ncbi:MAG: methyltransferase domain-containing protein [Proteobacteria bacterium]|nr:methyltransferase domain-containing protein [Pseudomonadota bacterium]
MSTGFYGADLAYVHDAGFGDHARGAAPFLLDTLAAAGIRGGTVVDLGCGTGIWLRALVDAGHHAVGIDISAPALALARAAAPGAHTIAGSAFTCDLPPCDAITALGEVLGYVARGRRPEPLAPLFERAAKSIRPGGFLIFDGIVEGAPALDTSGWRTGPDWAVLYANREDVAGLQVTREMWVFRETGADVWRRSRETHEVAVWRPKEVVEALDAAGFSVSTATAYGNFPLLPRRMAFIACLSP